MIQSSVPARVKALREAAGLSIRALADLMGMSSSGYAHYETPARFKDPFLPMRVALDLAAALQPYGINTAEVIALSGTATPGGTPSHPQPSGLAEAAAAPWSPPADRRRQTDTVIQTLAPTASNPGTYRLSCDIIALGLLRGDVIVVDRKAAPAPGDLALGNARTPDGDMVTVIGRYLPPLLFTSESLTSGQMLDVTSGDVAVYHPIVASFRSPIAED